MTESEHSRDLWKERYRARVVSWTMPAEGNRSRAMALMKAKLMAAEQQKRDSEVARDRKLQVGTGDRSERIRTYNFPQGRVTDHRINLTLYKLQAVMDGDLDDVVSALRTAREAEQLADQLEELGLGAP